MNLYLLSVLGGYPILFEAQPVETYILTSRLNVIVICVTKVIDTNHKVPSLRHKYLLNNRPNYTIYQKRFLNQTFIALTQITRRVPTSYAEKVEIGQL